MLRSAAAYSSPNMLCGPSLSRNLCRAISPGCRAALTPAARVTRLNMSTYGQHSYLSRHPDEKKPPIPYQIGSVLKAHAYAPPPPPDYHYTWARGQMKKDIEERHPLQLCLENPPAAGTPGQETLRLKIKQPIRVKDLNNSQVVQVEILHRETRGSESMLPASTDGVSIVAKFYDPLYYDYDEVQADPFANCDAAFAHETNAYHHLRQVWGTVVPRFYGSYSADVPLPDDPSRTRPVRTILYEYVPGTTLDHTEREDYSTSQRQAIMSEIMDCHSVLWQMDVGHGDLHPRNIIVLSANEGERAETRLIDLNMAVIGRRADRDGHAPTPRREPRSVIAKDWFDEDLRDIMLDFAWLVDWEWNEWLQNEYAKNGV